MCDRWQGRAHVALRDLNPALKPCPDHGTGATLMEVAGPDRRTGDTLISAPVLGAGPARGKRSEVPRVLKSRPANRSPLALVLGVGPSTVKRSPVLANTGLDLKGAAH